MSVSRRQRGPNRRFAAVPCPPLQPALSPHDAASLRRSPRHLKGSERGSCSLSGPVISTAQSCNQSNQLASKKCPRNGPSSSVCCVGLHAVRNAVLVPMKLRALSSPANQLGTVPLVLYMRLLSKLRLASVRSCIAAPPRFRPDLALALGCPSSSTPPHRSIALFLFQVPSTAALASERASGKGGRAPSHLLPVSHVSPRFGDAAAAASLFSCSQPVSPASATRPARPCLVAPLTRTPFSSSEN